MQLIEDFRQNSETRLIWTSIEAQKKWEPIINDIAITVNNLEVLSVVYGQRPCAWQTIHEDRLLEYVEKWNNYGLIAEPIKYSGIYKGFSHFTPEPKPGESKLVYCILSKSLGKIKEFRAAYKEGDNVKQGELLGFPKCCCEFFKKVWGEGYFDPMWQIFENSTEKEKIDPHINPFLRYAGIRLSFHIPCSLNCNESIKISKDRINLLKNIDNKKTDVLIMALLSMPFSWSALHGIAILKTPIFYLIYNTVPTNKEYNIELKGDFIPKEMPEGLKFPYNIKKEKVS